MHSLFEWANPTVLADSLALATKDVRWNLVAIMRRWVTSVKRPSTR